MDTIKDKFAEFDGTWSLINFASSPNNRGSPNQFAKENDISFGF